MSSPWQVRIASSGRQARCEAGDGGRDADQAAAAAMTRARPSRSESGPATQPPDRHRQDDDRDREAGRGGRHAQAALDVGQDRLRRVHVREHRRRAQEERDAGRGSRLGDVRRPGQDAQRDLAAQEPQERFAGELAPPAGEQRVRAAGVKRLARDERLEVGPRRDELRRHPGRRAPGLEHRGGERQHHSDAAADIAGQLRVGLRRRAGIGEGGQQLVELTARGGSGARARPRPPWASPDGGGRARPASRPSRARRRAGRGGGPRARATRPPRERAARPLAADLPAPGDAAPGRLGILDERRPRGRSGRSSSSATQRLPALASQAASGGRPPPPGGSGRRRRRTRSASASAAAAASR